MRASRRVAAAGLVVLAAACSTLDDKLGDQNWYREVRSATGKAADTAGDTASKVASSAGESASKAASGASETASKFAVGAGDTAAKVGARMQQYLAQKDLLQTFHDATEHSEGAVLDVLHRAGIGGKGTGGKHGGTGAQPGTAPQTGATPARPAEAPAPAPAPAPGVAVAPAAPALRGAPGVPDQYIGAYRWPLDAGIVSSEYGTRWGKVHKGIDIAASTGEPVYAVADGEVVYSGDGLRGYGNVVILRHDRQMSSLYAHNSALKVKVGDSVRQGTLISLLGSTGHSTGPHVHFEIRKGDDAVDPRSLLPKGRFAAAGQAEASRSAATGVPK